MKLGIFLIILGVLSSIVVIITDTINKSSSPLIYYIGSIICIVWGCKRIDNLNKQNKGETKCH